MKYCELSGWKRIIAEACRANPNLISEIDQMIKQQAQQQLLHFVQIEENLQAS
jgi:hypothetical protein